MKLEAITKMVNGKLNYAEVRIAGLILLSGSDYEAFRDNISLPDEQIRETRVIEPDADGMSQGAVVISSDNDDGLLIFDSSQPSGYCPFTGAKKYVEDVMEHTARSIVRGCICQEKATVYFSYEKFRAYQNIPLTSDNSIGPLLAVAFQRQSEVIAIKLDNELAQLELTLKVLDS